MRVFWVAPQRTQMPQYATFLRLARPRRFDPLPQFPSPQLRISYKGLRPQRISCAKSQGSRSHKKFGDCQCDDLAILVAVQPHSENYTLQSRNKRGHYTWYNGAAILVRGSSPRLVRY